MYFSDSILLDVPSVFRGNFLRRKEVWKIWCGLWHYKLVICPKMEFLTLWWPWRIVKEQLCMSVFLWIDNYLRYHGTCSNRMFLWQRCSEENSEPVLRWCEVRLWSSGRGRGETKTLTAFLNFCFLKLDFSFGEHHLKPLWLIWPCITQVTAFRLEMHMPVLISYVNNTWCHRKRTV